MPVSVASATPRIAPILLGAGTRMVFGGKSARQGTYRGDVLFRANFCDRSHGLPLATAGDPRRRLVALPIPRRVWILALTPALTIR
jgi:hypothetical protein